MYDYEINGLLRDKNYVITKEEYRKICNSPQINFIRYNPWSESFKLSTTEGMFVNFRVH